MPCTCPRCTIAFLCCTTDRAQSRTVAVPTAHSSDKSGTEPCSSWPVTHILPIGCNQQAVQGWHGWSEASLKSRFSKCWQSCKFGNKYFCKHASHIPQCLCKYLHILGLAEGGGLALEVQKNITPSWSISPLLLPLSTLSL